MLTLRYFEPCDQLRAYVSSFYCVIGALHEGQDLKDHLLPSPATVRIELKGNWNYRFGKGIPNAFPKVALIGPTNLPMEVSTRGGFSLIGADLTPLGLLVLWTTGVNDIVNRVVDYTPHVPEYNLTENLVINFEAIQEIFLKLLAPKLKIKIPSQIIETLKIFEKYTHDLHNDAYSVAKLVNALGVSERQSERISTRYFGFPPKQLMRRARFLRAVELILTNPNADWQDVAGHSYFDQSHFCREFKKFCHITPTQFFKRHQFLFEAAGMDFRKARYETDLIDKSATGYEFEPDRQGPKRQTILSVETAKRETVRPRSTLDFVSHLSR
jgi:AraC-like DNA-binding protein